MKAMFALIMLCLTTTVFAGNDTLKEIEQGELLHGTKWKAKQLKGKVVLVYYWGILCPMCKESTPGVIKLYNKYIDTEKFELIISNSQATPLDKVKKYYRRHKFSVYNQLKLGELPAGVGLPYFQLFDHEGNMVVHGRNILSTVSSKIKPVIDKAPDPMIAPLDLKHFQKAASALKFGKPVNSVLKSLKKKAGKDESKLKEADAISASVESWGKAKIKKTQTLLTTDLIKGMDEAKKVIVTFKSCEFAKPFTKEFSELKSDRNLAAFLTINRAADKAKKKFNKKKKNTHKSIRSIQSRLDTFMETEGLNEVLLSAAKTLKRKLPKVPKKS